MAKFDFIDKFSNLDEWSIKDSIEYAQELQENDLLYHIEDDAHDIHWSEGRIIPNGILDEMNAIADRMSDAERDAYFDEALKMINEIN